MDAFSYQAALGVAVPLLIERIKQRFPNVSGELISRVSRLSSVAISLATSAGFTWAVSGAGPCLVIPHGAAIIDWAARSILQYGVQEFTYRTTINNGGKK